VCGHGHTTSKSSIYKAPSYGLWNCSGNLKKLLTDKILVDENSTVMRWSGWLFIPSYESICVGFWRFLEGSLSFQWNSPPQVLLMKDLVCKFSSKICEWMEVRILSNVKFFKFYSWGSEARSWGKIETIRSVISQLTAEIFLTPDHTRGVHNALVMRAAI